MLFIPGKWTEEELDRIMRESAKVIETGSRIAALSEQFLGNDYRECTLVGDSNTPEVFVINLEGVDCFTFIDYIEAMRMSCSFSEFKVNLQKIRYRGGRVAFEDRNHFFTDWRLRRHIFGLAGSRRLAHWYNHKGQRGPIFETRVIKT